MSYHIYTTDGIILKRTPFGEGNVLVHILTRELGVVLASAQAARMAKSKLRPSLQEYSHVSTSLVHGKSGWKLTNVVDKENFFFDISLPQRKVVARVVSVLLQMIPGESTHPEVFETVQSGFEFLKSVSEKDISSFEILIILRILYELGYVVRDNDTESFLKETNVWSAELLEKISEKKVVLVGVINKGLKESQL